MKVLVALLLCSLAANAVFFFASTDSSDRTGGKVHAFRQDADEQKKRLPDETRSKIASLFDPARTSASTLKSRLEAAGFPPELVRATIRAQLFHDHQLREQALVGNAGPQPFWQTGTSYYGFGGGDPETEKAINALRRELRAQNLELLGTEVGTDDTAMAAYRQRWGPIPDAKVALIQRITNDYAELQREFMAGRSSMALSSEDQARLTLLQQEQRADLVAALTPEELLEYDLRASHTAGRLRSQLQPFNPSEEEYRAIFAAQHALDQASGRDANPMGVTFSPANSRTEERAALLERLKNALSTERLADFDFATNPSNTNLVRITNRLGLPLSTAREVVEVRATTMQAIARARGDASLSPVERNAQLAEITRSTTEQVTRLLGTKGYQAYLEHGANWLANPTASSPRP